MRKVSPSKLDVKSDVVILSEQFHLKDAIGNDFDEKVIKEKPKVEQT